MRLLAANIDAHLQPHEPKPETLAPPLRQALIENLKKIRQIADALFNSGVKTRDGLRTEALHTQWQQLQKLLSYSVPERVLNLDVGWREELEVCLLHDEALLNEQDAPRLERADRSYYIEGPCDHFALTDRDVTSSFAAQINIEDVSQIPQPDLQKQLAQIEIGCERLAGRNTLRGWKCEMVTAHRTTTQPPLADRQEVGRVTVCCGQDRRSQRRQGRVSITIPLAADPDSSLQVDFLFSSPIRRRYRLFERLAIWRRRELSGLVAQVRDAHQDFVCPVASILFHHAQRFSLRPFRDILDDIFRDAERPNLLAELAQRLPELRAMPQSEQQRLYRHLPALLKCWRLVPVTLDIATAVHSVTADDCLYFTVLELCPVRPTRADLQLLMEAADRLAAGSAALPKNHLDIARAALDRRIPAGEQVYNALRIILQRSVERGEVDYFGMLLQPLLAKFLDSEHVSLVSLEPLLRALQEFLDGDRMLDELARAVMAPKLTAEVSSPKEGQSPLTLLLEFRDLAAMLDSPKRSVQRFDWLSEPLPHGKGWLASYPRSFWLVARDWVNGDLAPVSPGWRRYLVEVACQLLEDDVICDERSRELGQWLRALEADAAVYESLALHRRTLAVISGVDKQNIATGWKRLEQMLDPSHEETVKWQVIHNSLALRDVNSCLTAEWDAWVVEAMQANPPKWRGRIASWHLHGLVQADGYMASRWASGLSGFRPDEVDTEGWKGCLDTLEYRLARQWHGSAVLSELISWLEEHHLFQESERPLLSLIASPPSSDDAQRNSALFSLVLRSAIVRLQDDTIRPAHSQENENRTASRSQTPLSPRAWGWTQRREVIALTFVACLVSQFLWGQIREHFGWPRESTVKLTNDEQHPASPPESRMLGGSEKQPIADSPSALSATWEPQDNPSIALLSLRNGPRQATIEFVRIEKGSYQWNDESIEIPLDFYFSRTEVTNEQMACVLDFNFEADKRDHPVVSLDWMSANKFCDHVRFALRDSAREFRLPTEFEWQFVLTNFCKSKESHQREEEQKALESKQRPAKESYPVSVEMATNTGVCGLLGNVSEWVQDWYVELDQRLVMKSDHKGPSVGTERVVRGRSSAEAFDEETIKTRFKQTPEMKNRSTGFRVVLVK